MAEVKLKAEPRTETGKGPARRTRAAGRVPAVLYGPAADPQRLDVDARELWHVLNTDAGMNVLVNLQVDGETHLALPREIQRDIVKGTVLHVDFLRIRRDVAIQVDVPIHLVGESVGVKEGGVTEHHLWELRVETLPGNVPESIEADVTELNVGDSLHVTDLPIPEGVTVLTADDETIVSIVPPQAIEEPEPEVVEGEEGEEGAEAAEGEEGAEGEARAEGEGGESADGGEGS
jgi:large subunit ribosomal protein L25